jgi:hypothetical protein
MTQSLHAHMNKGNLKKRKKEKRQREMKTTAEQT